MINWKNVNTLIVKIDNSYSGDLKIVVNTIIGTPCFYYLLCMRKII